MATIRQSLTLQDRMSPVLSSIMKSMRSTINVMEQMNAAAGRPVSGNAWNQARRDIENAEDALRNFGNEEDNVEQQANRVKKSFSGWQAAIVTVNQALQLAGQLVGTLEKPIQIADGFIGTDARLRNINDGLQTQQELQEKIYASAQRSRGEYSEVANTVAKLNLLAGDTFASNDAAIAFAEIMNKAFAVSGADPSEASAALRQMTQALASGRLQGDEFTSIRENAPLVAQAIQNYMGVSAAEMKELASEGAITADIIKAAVFSAGDDISAMFEEMPLTFEQSMTKIKNAGLFAFQPLIYAFSDFVQSDTFEVWSDRVVNAIRYVVAGIQYLGQWAQQIEASPGFQLFAEHASAALSTIGNLLLGIGNIILTVVGWVFENWGTLEPILLGAVIVVGGLAAAWGAYNAVQAITHGIELISIVLAYAKAAATGTEVAATTAATAAQYGLNTAMLASPVTWIVLAVIALVAAIIAVAQWLANTAGIAGSAFGVITGGINVVIQFFWNLLKTVGNVAMGIWNAMGAVASNIGIAFNNVIQSVIGWFYDLLSSALTTVAGIAEALNKLPFVEFDYSGITNAASEYANKSAEAYGKVEEFKDVAEEFNKGMQTFEAFGEGWASDAFRAGADWGDGIANSVGDMLDSFGGLGDLESMVPDMPDPNAYDFGSYGDFGDFADGNGALNTNSTGGKLDKVGETTISDEDLKYLRDIAQIEYVNQYTTQRPVVYATFGDVRETADVNQVLDALETVVVEAYNSSLDRG